MTRKRKKGKGALPGLVILQNHKELGIQRVVRGGGLNGPLFQYDLISGEWKTFYYECGTEKEIPNPNWFSIQDFLNAVGR